MSTDLQGYYPIVPTAYHSDGQVDLAAMRRLTEYLIASGAQGMSPNGGDSEARYLSEEERMRVLDAVLETNAGRTPVLVGCSAPTTAESARLCAHAQRAGAGAAFVMPPANWMGTLLEPLVTDEEMLAHYQAISEGLDLPLMIHATKAMDLPFFARLLERLPNVRYIKEETTFGSKLRRYVQALGGRVTVFGPGLHTPAELGWGTKGYMPSCCAPRTHARVYDLWRAGRQAEARQEWNRMLPLVFWRWHTSAQEAGKVYLAHMGVFQTAYVRCGGPSPVTLAPLALDEADRRELRQVLAAMGEPPY
jgi:dihydrodipicolinate synthase/N-acetylneuraminate lyase